jgi:hypothetical protein
VAGSIPAVGAGEAALPTLQPVGSYLAYSTSTTKGPSTLSIKYKTKAGVIQRYDDTANPKINTATGNPIWVIQSTGTAGSSSRAIYAEVCRSRFNILARGALVAHVGISFKGNIKVCGHDHRADTPAQIAPNACDVSWHAANPHTTCMPGAWTEADIQTKGSPTVQGNPVATSTYQTGFYSGPWDAMGMTQSDFWSWVGAARSVAPNPPSGIIYLDNDGVKQNASGSWSYNGGDGEGLLYCDGDLTLNGAFTFRGMIYCEGDLKINGNSWILGGLIVKGKSVVKIANGSAIVLYSGDAMQQKISKFGGNLRTLAWREF